MNERDVVRMRHMLDEAHKVRQAMQGRTRDELNQDWMLSYAAQHALQIIGEAASRVTQETREEFPDIEWKNIIGMRQWLVHGYDQVKQDIVWMTVQKDVPLLIREIRERLAASTAGW
jgi:uncharacterized protein with HEPN domain